MNKQAKERQVRRDAISEIADLLERHRVEMLDGRPLKFAGYFSNLLLELRRRARHRPRGSASEALPALSGNRRQLYRCLFEIAATVVNDNRDEVVGWRQDYLFVKQFDSIVAEFQRRSGTKLPLWAARQKREARCESATNPTCT